MDNKATKDLAEMLSPEDQLAWLSGFAAILAEAANDVEQTIERGETATTEQMGKLAEAAFHVLGMLQVTGYEAGPGSDQAMRILSLHISSQQALERVRKAIYEDEDETEE